MQNPPFARAVGKIMFWYNDCAAAIRTTVLC